jgi:O-antigen ligase
MTPIFIGILAIIYLILAIYRLDWAVLVMISALPAYLLRTVIFGVPLTFLEIMILIAFAVWFVRTFRPYKYNPVKFIAERKNAIAYPFKYEIILFLIISWAAVAVAHFSPAASGIWKAYFVEPILVFILVINIFRKEGIGKIIWAFTFSALVISLFAIYQKITGQFIPNEFWAGAANRRVVSFFDFPNAVGLYLAPLVLLMVGFLFKIIKSVDPQKINSQKYVKVGIIAGTVVLSVLAIIFAQSKGALVGIIVGLFLGGLLVNKKSRILTIIIAVVFAIAVVSYQPAYKSVKETITLQKLSGQIRQQQWVETKKMFWGGYWFWGAGLSGYQTAVAPYHQAGIFIKTDDPNWLEKIRADKNFRDTHWQPTEIYMYPHNIFLNFWTELGLLGLVLMIWIMGKYLLWGEKNNRQQRRLKNADQYIVLGLTAAMVAIIAHGLVDVPYFKNDLSVMFWILLALLGLYNIRECPGINPGHLKK